eukprot:TRINITY_DN8978_c0_g1_i1.p1 TRINITY_DN8978_c0_g1~~TRINITY_DN8978_c0_g1_i1.p1  ORF type:complete len:307 (+),score=38.94 TRINITY_DN8978_c0_g1_i1:159-1079(+)
MAYTWRVTLFTQTTLFCLGALLMTWMHVSNDLSPALSPLDFYFISVEDLPGRSRSALAYQMQVTAKDYGVRFIVSPGGHSNTESLQGNIHEPTNLFASLHVPWYFSSSLKGEDHYEYFNKVIPMPLNHTLELIVINTTKLKDYIMNNSSMDNQIQIQWFKRVLEGSTSDWRIVIGQDPLFCADSIETTVKEMKLQELLLPIFTKHQVHVYLHGETNRHLKSETSSPENVLKNISSYNSVRAMEVLNLTHRSTTKNRENVLCIQTRNIQNGFILHRVSPIEMESYFMDLKGNILQTTFVRQGERQPM